MKIYPVGLGNHDNIYYMAKVKNLFTMKIMCKFDSCTAHVLTCKTANPSFAQYLDPKPIYEKLESYFTSKDFVLVTKVDEVLIDNGSTKSEKFIQLKNQLLQEI